MAYHPSAQGSLAAALRELRATFDAGGDVTHQAHNLLGTSRTAGANVLAQEVTAFKRAPSAAALDSMCLVLDATHKQMVADGLLPANAFDE